MGGGGGKGAEVIQYEPVKTAEQSIKEASSDASRAQQLRRGISSTFSRSTFGKAAASSATAGASHRLGG